MLESVWNDGHLERIARWIADRETHAIDGDASFIYGEVAFLRHLSVLWILKGEIGAAVGIFHCDALRCLIDVPLYDMTVQTTVHQHRALHVHLVAYL